MDIALAPETLARWQFGITTVYHFLFVPLTISLAALVAGLETAWVRTGKVKYFHATKFWGKLFLINIAMGVVTGIVQEFQFGMNWSDYSRFVGDVFGAPLAMEALIAFFFESTFIGLWIFGWDKLPKKLHAACMWMVALGTVLSAYFILAANSWMQHPVGYRINEANGRAELTDIAAVLFQNTTLVVVFHTLTAAFLTGAAFMVGISAFHLLRARRTPAAERDGRKIAAMRTSLRLGLVVATVFGLGTALSGDSLSKVMFEQQPMKMAAAEALWETESPAPFSVFAYGDVDKGHNTVAIEIPGLLSYLANGDLDSEVPGINDTEAQLKEQFGDTAADYKPIIPVTYWGFRWMIGFGMASFAVAVAGLWLTRKRFWVAPEKRTGSEEVPRLMLTRNTELGEFLTTWAWRAAVLTLGFPLIANSWGWIFTEMGRQPWSVYGLFTTADSVSPGVTQAEVLTSLIVFTLLYGILAVVEVRLLVKYAQTVPVHEEPPAVDPTLRGPGTGGTGAGGGDGADTDADKPLVFAY
ncbi:cytochrome ubiquinol oxidase subunit I [Streptomyces sp. NPDC059506]|uniref:cytochrome ubiquinol oxidase subunit I n=1 Tax=Streptomyces TaxID=1883 RepID=UPI000CADCBD2|nr:MULTISPECIES: cytochrome ubiquinol oxidase subunit I [unclassified Streptomyces]MCZ2525105.1 cytochrome ubiquinol oxidase subunit I [Streptomyces sp. HB2AG]PLW73901.1 cytochrome ubiquinol oxidase subunit I [Streptomyces sp. DJ]QMV22556.1 cytochrome ubiquinol oxidase subunit I [Streptomyces sp. SCUT-3]